MGKRIVPSPQPLSSEGRGACGSTPQPLSASFKKPVSRLAVLVDVFPRQGGYPNFEGPLGVPCDKPQDQGAQRFAASVSRGYPKSVCGCPPPSFVEKSLRLAILLYLLAAAGCSRQDSECLARITRKVAARVGDVTGEVKDTLGTGWQNVYGELGLEARVSARLRWDKSLAEAAIEVTAQGNDIELNGTIKDPVQRQRALDLTATTTGVEKVTEHLQLADGP